MQGSCWVGRVSLKVASYAWREEKVVWWPNVVVNEGFAKVTGL